MKKKKFLLISFISVFCLTICGIIVLLCINKTNGYDINNNYSQEDAITKLDYYNSDLFPIEEATQPTTNVVELSTLYSITKEGVVSPLDAYNSYSNTTIINISSANDLYAFSYLSNNYQSDSSYPFLGYSYQLTQNINYDDCIFPFYPIGFKTGNGFSGSFNGNGYEISNLDFDSINAENVGSYNNIDYYSMFPLVLKDSQISNFGIINPNINNAVKPDNLVGTSIIAGVNFGHIGYVFVRDLRDIDDDAGINAVGQGRISALVGKNGSNTDSIGTVENSYVAVTVVVSTQNNEYLDFNELLVENYATVSNLYYYNSIITDYSYTADKESVEYSSIGVSYSQRIKYGTRCESVDALTTAVLNLTDSKGVKHWKDETSYGVDEKIFDITTPITRGIACNSANKVFYIDDEMGFAYMFELMRESSFFASNQVTYEIRSDLDLSLLNPDAYRYDKAIAATIKGISGTYNSVTINGEKSIYPTIFNPTFKNYALNEGVECYGIFPYLSGTVKDINVVITQENYTLSYISTSSNSKAIGFVSGLVEGGLIDNVNVYAQNVILNDNINKYYYGSIAGIIDNGTAIQNVTAKLSFDDGEQNAVNDSIVYDKGIALGGIVGFIAKRSGNVYHALSCVNFNLNLKAQCEASVGGIIGSGYSRTYNDLKTSELENRGNITINAESQVTNLYVAGIFAHHLGMQNAVSLFNNVGDITLNSTGTVITYVAGVSNVDLNSNSLFKEEGKRKYVASGFTNASNISVTSSSGTVYYAGVLNINSASNFISLVDNMYNLGYKTISNIPSYLSEQIIEMSALNSYAGVINNIGGSVNYTVKAEIVYNFRNVIFKNESAIDSKTLNYSAVILGEYINYYDVRNEGNITVNLISGFTTSNTLNIEGVFDTLSMGCTASEIYNGGNITITDQNATEKILNINISGILRINDAVIDDVKQNPLDNSFDNSLVGSLDKAINNGDILLTSVNYDKNNVTANNSALSTMNLKGNVNAAGIVLTNSGIISNVFNLGDITLDIYARTATSYNAGGIACEQNGNYAQIRDTANNGDIQLINMSKIGATLTAAGITAKNSSTKTNFNQIISFTINYGSIVVFNAYNNMSTPSIGGSHAIASGILGKGFCNTVNVVNYGNIHSSETAAGMVCIANLNDFTNPSASLANTLNYGNIYAIRKYYSDSGNLVYLPYSEIIKLDSKYIFAGDPTIQHQYIGAIISIINYGSSTLNIRYLINFYRATAIVSTEINSPSTTIDTTTFITTRGSADTFAGQSVGYAPLSTISDELGNIGVFSEEFVFYRAIDGAIDENIVTDKYISDFFAFIRFDKINDTLLDKIGWRAIAYTDAATQLARNLSALNTLLGNAGYNSTSDLISEAMNSNTWLSSCDSEIVKSIISVSLDSGNLTDNDLKDILDYILFDPSSTTVIASDLRTNIINSVIDYYTLENTDYYVLLQKLLYDELLAKLIAEEDSNYTAALTKIQSIIANANDEELENVLSGYISALLADDANEILSPLFNEYNDEYLTKKMNLVNTLINGYSVEILNEIYNSIKDNDLSSNADSLKYQMYLQDNPDKAKEIYSALFIFNSTAEANADYQEALQAMLKKYDIASIIDDSFSVSSMVDNNASLSGSAYINGSEQIYSKNYTELWNIIKNDTNLQQFISNNYFKPITDPTSSINYSALIAKATEYNNTYQSQDAPSISDSDDNKEGVFRTTSIKDDIKNRFIYTPDEVNNVTTYYYGPFNSSGNIWNSTNMASKNPSYNQGYDIYANQAVSTTKKTYFPFFMTTNYDILKNQVANSNTTTSFSNNHYDIEKGYTAKYIWNDVGKSQSTTGDYLSSAGQWVSDYILGKRADDVTAILYKNYNTGEYIVDNYDFSPNKIYCQTGNADNANYISEINVSNIVDGVDIKLTENNKYAHGNKVTNNPYEEHFLMGYATSDIITGIWAKFDLWYSSGPVGAYITSKKDTKDQSDGNYIGIHTSQYTYYQIKDLVKLDGIRTKGKNTGTTDADEISIISALMTMILSTDAGKKVVLKALANYGSNNTIINDNVLNMLASSLINTDISGSAITDIFTKLSSSELENIKYSDTQNLKQYFDSMILGESYTTQQNITLIASSNIDSFKKLLEIVLTKIPDNGSGSTITSKDTQYFLSNYVSYLRSIGKTDAEIIAAINSVNATDLEAFVELSNLDFDYQISSGNIADTTGTEYIFYKFDVEHTGEITINEETKDNGDTSAISSWIIPANTNIDISGDGNIIDYSLYGVNSIATGNDSLYYVLEITFSDGNITINGQRQLAAPGEKLKAQWVLNANTEYPITTTDYPEITEAKIYKKNVIELHDSATVTVKFNGTVTINNITKTTNDNSEQSWYLEAGIYPVDISAGTTIEYLNYPITYELPQVIFKKGEAQKVGNNAITLNNVTETYLDGTNTKPLESSIEFKREETTIDNTKIVSFDYGKLSFINVPIGTKIKLDITGGNLNITTSESFSSSTSTPATIDSYNGESWFFRSSAKQTRTITQIQITYTIKYGNDSITYTQYLFGNGNNSSINGTDGTTINDIKYYQLDGGEITTFSNISGLANGNHTCHFICSDGTNVQPSELKVSDSSVDASIFKPVDLSGFSNYADLSAIEDRYNTYYDSLSNPGKFIASNLAHVNDSTSSFTVTEPSIILVKTSDSGGTVTIDSKSKTATADKYIAFYVSEANTYNITTNNATITNVLIVNTDSKLIVNQDIDSTTNDSIKYNNGETDKLIFTGSNYTDLSTFDLSITTHSSEMLAAVKLLFPSMYTGNSTYTSGKEYYIFNKSKISGFTDEELKNIIILFAKASYNDENSVLGKLIANLNSTYYDNLILDYDNQLGTDIICKIWSIAKTKEYSNIISLFLAGYVGNDYLDCNNKLLSSKMYSILEGYANKEYQYIISNTSVDSDKFLKLITHLGITSSTEGFGIYALSSSAGIKDGIFIPDNFVLEDMDAKYTIDDAHHIVLASESSSNWRGGNAIENDDITDEDSVNYAVLEEMKQLKKSIATTIFTLNLKVTESENDLVLYSSPELIDLENHIITYYIPNDMNISTSATINKLVIANRATADKSVGSELTFSYDEGSKKYLAQNAIKITAEDVVENAMYTIIIKKVSMSFNLSVVNTTVTDGQLVLNVTSPKNLSDVKIPTNLDLTPFITISDSSDNVIDQYNHEAYTYFSLSNEDGDHIIDEAGSATITMNIFDTLPAGTYKLTLTIYKISEYVSFTKSENDANEIWDVQFDGKIITLEKGKTVTSKIPYGIAYSDTNLNNYEYLDHEPSISPGATVNIAVSKKNGSNSTVYYDIIYTITSESNQTAVYTHRLQEIQPFTTGDEYASLFKDGETVGTFTFNNKVTASYSRDEGSPTYRVRYAMDNFYYGDNTTFTYTPSAETGVSINASLSEGMSLNISTNASPKTYSYSYVYKSEGTWEGKTYYREYVFPRVEITKETSKDASLSKLTFLDDYNRLSGTNTVVNPNYAMLPESLSEGKFQEGEIGENEKHYLTIKNETPKKVTVGSNSIDYTSSGNNYNTFETSSGYFTNHFYALGIVSNTVLNYYAPTFAIEKNAEIYQYITQEIIDEYGLNQTKTDTEILNNMDVIYIYVPFVKKTEKDNEDRETTILLVKLNNGSWGEVYNTSFYVDNLENLGNMNGSKDTEITIDGVTYVVDSSAGKPTNNNSLNMDYIGTPKLNHFWYVSYVVFSESYLNDSNIGTTDFDNPYYKAYHISIIDQSNNVFYEVSIKAPIDFNASTLYLNMNINVYDEDANYSTSQQISASAVKDVTSQYAGYNSYSLERSLQILPSGYYYFYISLPEGYSAKYTVSKENTNKNENETGAYLPPSSIVTQRIILTIEIYKNNESDGTVWGVSNQTNYIRLITQDFSTQGPS